MIGKFGLAAAAILVSAVPAMAQSCGSLPIAPAIPSAAEIMQKSPADAATTRHNAFLDVKNWQADLKTYRDCLNSMATTDDRRISTANPQKDADKISGWQEEKKAMSAAYDHSADSEKRVVSDYSTMYNAYCGRTDVDQSVCPKKKQQ